MKMARAHHQEPLAGRIFQLMQIRMESILRAQDLAIERQQHQQEQHEREHARNEKSARVVARKKVVANDVEDEKVKPVEKAPAVGSPTSSSPVPTEKGTKRPRAESMAKFSSAKSDVAPPAKKTARKAPVNPFLRKSVASPQKSARAQDVLKKLAASPTPQKPLLGRQSSAALGILKRTREKKLF